jgi:hypothetical protein
MGRSTEGDKIYDDDIVQNISKEFDDRITSLFVIGDVIRSLRKLIKRKEITVDEFVKHAIRLITLRNHVFREDIIHLTKIDPVFGNVMLPFMNGGPEEENRNKSVNGFYDWIDNKSKESILEIELGFKADNYGLEVSRKLIQRKKMNPDIDINLLIDGFVSILMQKPPSALAGFEINTIKMIDDMREAGINVYNNDIWNPLSLWIFWLQIT